MRKLVRIVIVVVAAIAALVIWRLFRNDAPEPGTVLDEALAAGRGPDTLPAADEDYYADMDDGITRDPQAVQAALEPYLPDLGTSDAVRHVVRGRNHWMVWTAGNDRLWDLLTNRSAGSLDLLKTLSNHPALRFNRDTRWSYLGLVNEPCFRKGNGPREDRFGLWLDVRDPWCDPDPFENEVKYPGVKTGARGTTVPVGSYYGYATGVVGLRLFPNPAFDDKARKRWDPVRYYTDQTYYADAKLVRPYRVGMACAFCHAGPEPTHPPTDPEHPKWENLSSNPGAQYFWFERIFFYDGEAKNFVWQLLHTSRPGTLDTSLVCSDQIDNPRSMNAIYNLGARIGIAEKWGSEQLAGGCALNRQFNDVVPPGTALTRLYDEATQTVRTTHVLADGADSVGALGALNRVSLNIGLFSEEWLLHFTPMVGGADVSPIRIADAERNSAYWNANARQTPDLALFLLASARPDLLKNAPGGPDALAIDAGKVERGKEVFAARCARCHSSKLPPKAFTTYFQPGCIGSNYLRCWNDYWTWTKTAEFRAAMTPIVKAPDFLDGNYLSTDLRVPVTLLETNVCSSLATNALRGNIWDNFSSESYKNLPSVGRVQVHDPYSGEASWYEMPGGGRGFTRPASLISLWSTAPYLQNNTVGRFYARSDVASRLRAFDEGITKMLWPEKRDGNGMFATLSGKPLPGWIDRTTRRSDLSIGGGSLPRELARLSGPLAGLFPNFFGGGGVQIGPIPAGTPVGLLSNVDLRQTDRVLSLLLALDRKLDELPAGASDEEARKRLAPLVPKLLEVSKCPDFVVNRGHYFGTAYLPETEGEPGLSDDDKHALIAFLKSF